MNVRGRIWYHALYTDNAGHAMRIVRPKTPGACNAPLQPRWACQGENEMALMAYRRP